MNAVDVLNGDLVDVENIMHPYDSRSFKDLERHRDEGGLVIDKYRTLPDLCRCLSGDDHKFCIVENGNIIGVLISPQRYAAMRGTVNLAGRVGEQSP